MNFSSPPNSRFVSQKARRLRFHYPSNTWQSRAMAQAVSRWPLTAKARVRARSIHVGFVVDKVALGRFSPSTSVSPANISFHQCSILIYHRPMRCAIALTKQHTITTSVLSLGASLLTRHIGWKQKQKGKKKVILDKCWNYEGLHRVILYVLSLSIDFQFKTFCSADQISYRYNVGLHSWNSYIVNNIKLQRFGIWMLLPSWSEACSTKGLGR
jgi:hypothetical protein